jgi:hypothetical protein
MDGVEDSLAMEHHVHRGEHSASSKDPYLPKKDEVNDASTSAIMAQSTRIQEGFSTKMEAKCVYDISFIQRLCTTYIRHYVLSK